MENITKISKFFMFTALLFFILWLGGYIARHLFIFQLFEPEKLALREYFNMQNVIPVFYSITSTIIFNIVSFTIFIFSFSVFLLTSGVNLKKEGWLLITTLIVYLTAPMEIFLLTFDYHIVQRLLSQVFSSYEMLTLLKERMTVLGSFPLAEIFAYIFIVFLILFRPFKMKHNEN